MTVSVSRSESSLFDDLHAALNSNPAEAIESLVNALSAARRAMPAEEWRQYCSEIASHPTLGLLTEDPYTRDARAKVAGYAGDARTLDYVYLLEHREDGISRLGGELFRLTTGVPIAQAVRSRCETLAEEINRLITGRPEAMLTVASIACGHARELDRIAHPDASRLRYWGIDQDVQTVALASKVHTLKLGAGSAFEASSIGAVIRGSIAIPRSDLIYASGLFDYLDLRTGSLLLRRMVDSLNVGGRVMIANLSPANEEVAFMEAIMDWWMVYRTEQDMLALAENCAVSSHAYSVTTSASFDSRLSWLIVERRGDAP